MAFCLTVAYGDLVFSHDEEMDTAEAQERGVYSATLDILVGKLATALDAGIACEPDFDAEAEELEAAAALIPPAEPETDQ